MKPQKRSKVNAPSTLTDNDIQTLVLSTARVRLAEAAGEIAELLHGCDLKKNLAAFAIYKMLKEQSLLLYKLTEIRDDKSEWTFDNYPLDPETVFF